MRPTKSLNQQITAAQDVITITGDANYSIAIYNIVASFDSQESNAHILVEDEDSNVLFKEYFDNSVDQPFGEGLWVDKGKDVTVTLSAGGAGVEGALNIIYRQEP